MKTHKKIVVGLLVFLFICVVGIFLDYKKSMRESPILQGSYTCDKLPFTSMEFDLDNSYTFYYYNFDEMDKGTYSKGSGNEHFINSPKFHNTKIVYNGKKRTFTVMMGGETYLFKQISKLPTIKDEPEKKEE
ncbi:hypothetical protein ABFV83_09095 [Lacrimispora sp. BS-2]|uniref:Uncharacterized protein n=1 Tax=Lacrimispora sp. BS-2 TaxID=3151850 RepID=A0AAU7PWK2_9FIRM